MVCPVADRIALCVSEYAARGNATLVVLVRPRSYIAAAGAGATIGRIMNNATVRNSLGKLLALAWVLLAPSLHAGPHTWSGAVNGNWSTAGNWSAGGVPVIGEASLTLTFPGSATRTVTTNNIGALTVTSMTFSGSNYIVRGASTITFGSSLINVLCSGNSNTIESTLNLPGNFAVSVADNDVMAFHTLTGAGAFLKFGGGDVHLRGTANNTLSGGYIVNTGVLELHKTGLGTAVGSALSIVGTTNFGDNASVRLFGPDQIGGGVNVTIHATGLLNLNGQTNTLNNLTVMAGSVFGSGLLRLNGALTLSAQDNPFPTPDLSPLIQGNLEFIGASSTITVSNLVCEVEANIIEEGGATTINKEGPGTLWLQGGGNNPGNIVVNAGTLRAELSASLGTVAGTTTVAPGASLILGAGMTTSESLNLAGGGVGGQGALQTASGLVQIFGNISLTGVTSVRVPLVGHQLLVNGMISGAGGLRKLGEGQLWVLGAGTNTFNGVSFVDKGLLTLDKGDNVRAIGSVTVTNGATLTLNSHEQIDNAGVLSIYTGGAFTMANFNESIGGLNLGAGVTVDSGTGTLTMLGNFYAGPPYSTGNEPATIRGNLSLGGATRTVMSNDYGVALVFDCAISDGAGTGGLRAERVFFSLLRSNSFTGPVLLSGGYCSISNSFAFGAPGGGVFSTNTDYSSVIIFLPATAAVSGETLTVGNNLFIRPNVSSAWNNPIVLTNGGQLLSEPVTLADATLTVNGKISGNGSVWAGSGILRLTQSNDFTGIAGAVGGTLAITHPHALGTTNQGTTIYQGSTLRLELPNGAVVNGEPLSFLVINPIPFTNDSLTVVGAVSNSWNSAIIMDSQPVRVNVLDPSGTLRLNDAIGGVGGLEKTGSGQLILAGTNANTYTGGTVVTNGTLVLNKPNGVQAVGNLVVNYPATLHWAGSEQIADAATLTLYGGDFSGHTNAYLGSHDETVTDLALRRSILTATTGALTLLGHVDLTHGSIFGNFNRIHATVRLGPGDHQVFNMSGPGTDFAALSLVGSVHETGGSGGLTVLNCGLQLHGSNSFSGPVIVNGSVYGAGLSVRHPHALGSPAQGTLLTNSANLDLAMPSGSVLAGESLVLANHRPGAFQPCSLTMYGEFTNTWAGPITLLETNWVQITFGSKLTVDGPVFGPAILNSIGNGELVLAGAQPNTITGLIMDEGILRLAKPAGVPAFLGDFSLITDGFDSVPPTLILEASGQFPPQTVASVGVGGTNATLNLNGHAAVLRGLTGGGTVNIGTGTLTLGIDSGFFNFVGTTLGAPGGTRVIKQGVGTQVLFGNNALNGDMLLQGGTLQLGNSTIGALNLSAGTLADLHGQVYHFGSLSGAGTIYTSGNGTIFVGANHLSTTYAGVIQGGSQTNLVKVGTGALTLTGANTDTGKTVVQNGTLLVNGSLNGPVHVERTAPGTTATLGGNGILKNTSVVGLGARLAPGATTSVPSYGKLTAVNVAVVDGAIYACEIGGTNAGVNLDQIEATDTFTLSGVTPASGVASFTAFGAGAVSNRYAVVKSAAAVNGTFNGDPEGDYIYPTAGRAMRITYLTAAGKEITLIEEQGSPLGNIEISGIVRGTNGHITLTGTGVSGALYTVQANTNLNTTNWVFIGTSTGNFNGAIRFTDTNAPSFPMRFYRFLLP